jgi:two-component system phosphate regulon sensor histidine kinase PhoR
MLGQYQPHNIKPAKGELGEILNALTKVSERLSLTLSEEQAETGLITAERNKLRSVLDSMTDGVFAVDSGGRIILFNKAAAELTGRSIEEAAGQLAEKVLPFRQDGQLIMTRWLTDTEEQKHFGQWQNLELYKANGNRLYVNVQAVKLVRDPNGIRALITFHDLTKSHQLEQMQVDFVALAAHELRTPVTQMRGYLDLLTHESNGLNKEGRQLVDEGVIAARQLSRLINHLLGVAQIEHGELTVEPELVDWADFVTDVVEHQKITAGKRKLELIMPKRLPKLTIDPTGMREVLTNLIDNAIAHTDRAKGHITISVRQIGGQIETNVSDNGHGVPAEALPKLFTRFFRADGLHTTHGTGLGLYISRAIVQAHHGSITAQSPAGQGATFTFYLPVTKGSVGKLPAATLRRGSHGWIKTHSVR